MPCSPRGFELESYEVRLPLENHRVAPLGRENLYVAYKPSGLAEDGRVHALRGVGKLGQTPSHIREQTSGPPSRPGPALSAGRAGAMALAESLEPRSAAWHSHLISQQRGWPRGVSFVPYPEFLPSTL